MCALSTLGIASEEEEEEEEDDTWDDTVLIDAYDKAVGLAMKEVERRMEQGQLENGGTESTSSRKDNKKTVKSKKTNLGKCKNKESLWKVGMPCQAVYTEDGAFYEAIIESLSLEDDTCVVKFLGYNNRQSMSINDLFISQGKEYAQQQIEEAQLAMESEAQAGAMEWQTNAPSSTTATKGKATKQMEKIQPMPEFPPSNFPAAFDSSIKMDIPPPPPIFTSHLPADEAEALSSMCMSWYLNGFHTGYYLGLKQGQKPQ